jgi:hypothetical protein
MKLHLDPLSHRPLVGKRFIQKQLEWTRHRQRRRSRRDRWCALQRQEWRGEKFPERSCRRANEIAREICSVHCGFQRAAEIWTHGSRAKREVSGVKEGGAAGGNTFRGRAQQDVCLAKREEAADGPFRTTVNLDPVGEGPTSGEGKLGDPGCAGPHGVWPWRRP